MKTMVIANPKAAGGKVGRKWTAFYETIQRVFDNAEIRLTHQSGHAIELTREAIDHKFERIAVVGGDGTLNEVVNGLFDESGNPIGSDVCVMLIPAGTGGDFARTIGVRDIDPEVASVTATCRAVDIGRLTAVSDSGREVVRYFINIASMGSSGAITKQINESSKLFGSKGTYLLGTLRGLLTYKNQRVRLRIDDTVERELVVSLVAVANGRYFGGSMKISPESMINDGLLDVVVIGDVGLKDFARHNPKLYRGEHLELDKFESYRGKKIEITPLGSSDILLEADGESLGRLPVVVDVVPQAVQICAPWERVDAIVS